jgi:hypothetical protein
MKKFPQPGMLKKPSTKKLIKTCSIGRWQRELGIRQAQDALMEGTPCIQQTK